MISAIFSIAFILIFLITLRDTVKTHIKWGKFKKQKKKLQHQLDLETSVANMLIDLGLFDNGEIVFQDNMVHAISLMVPADKRELIRLEIKMLNLDKRRDALDIVSKKNK